MVVTGSTHRSAPTPRSSSTPTDGSSPRGPAAPPARTTWRYCVGQAKHDTDRVWALEDCRNMTRRLEQDLLAAGERIVRVPPKLMAHTRDAARTDGKSDPIDALAVARAALREDDLPVAHLDGPDRDVRLLVDHREDLIAERTRAVNRLRWHPHELDADWDPPARSLDRVSNLNRISQHLAGLSGLVARLAAAISERCRQLTLEIDALEAEIKTLTEHLAPNLIAIPGCASLTAAKILGETASILRFRSAAAYARHNGTAPLPVWSSNRGPPPPQPHRQPPTQRRIAPHRHDPSPLPPTSARPRRTTQSRRRRRPGGTPRPQTAPLRRRLPSTTRRPRHPPTSRRLTEEQFTVPADAHIWPMSVRAWACLAKGVSGVFG